jgi:HK97 gp10 family phage protein
MIGFDADEVERLADDLDGAEARVVAGAARVMDDTGRDSVAAMRALSRVDTGAMRASCGYDLDADGLGFEAGPTVFYAPFNEYGTSRMSPQPFVIPGFEAQLPAAFEGLEQALVDGLLR